ncbi:MAG TPA: hypothetical protein VGN04_13700 [Herbaspirillum sp.]
MTTTAQTEETALDGTPASQSGKMAAAAPLPALPRPPISFGVPYDSLLDEFERNTAEAQAESIQASIFTPAYGQPF